MKRLMLVVLLFVSSCAWKQRDFEKDIDKSSGPAPQVEGDKALMEKFEVKTVEEAAVAETKVEAVPVTKPSSTSKTRPKPPVKTQKKSAKKLPEVQPALPKEQAPQLPKDYPSELSVLDQKAKNVWEQYRPNHRVGERIFLDIHYLGMTVGKIMFTNNGKKMVNGKEVWHLHARFKSAPFYSKIYELDDTVDTYVTTDEFLSTRYSLIQRESKQDIDDLQLHDREQLKTFSFYKQKKSNGDVKNKQDEKFIPYYSIDPFSVLFFYQGLPLNTGDLYEIPIINKSKVLILKSRVEGREVISTDQGDKKAIKVHATTTYTGDHLKSGDLTFWFSDDQKRTLLRAKAKIKIGTVTADIVDD